MSGTYADLAGLVALADRYDAVVYVDDAHGIGVLGRDPGPTRPYGSGGGGVAAYQRVAVDRLVYVGGLSKAFSSMAALVTCSSRYPRRLFESATTMVFSGPIPVASLASALAGLDVNRQEGDALRARLHGLTARLVDGLHRLGFDVGEHRGFPIVNVVIGGPSAVTVASEVLWRAGVLATPSVFPAAPIESGGVRFTLTASNTEAEVDRVLEAMSAVREGVAEPVVLG
jgi:7-keto-8-aminopelargonate synthetase-like enzyme